MDLRFSPEENAFRQEVRTLLPQRDPAGDPHEADRGPQAHQGGHGHVAEDAAPEGLGRLQLAEGMGRLRLDAGPAVHLPRGDAAQRRAAAGRLQYQHERSRASSSSAPTRRRRSSCRAWPRSTTGGARASRSRAPARTSPRSRRRRCARATTTSSTARRPGRRSPSTPTGSSASCAPIPSAKKQLGISYIVFPMTSPGVTRAPDPAHRRRPRGQRGVLRRRQGAGRESRSARRTAAGTAPNSCSATSASASPASAPRRCASPRIKQLAKMVPSDGGSLMRRSAVRREGRRRRGRAEGARDDADALPRRRARQQERQAQSGDLDAQAQGLRDPADDVPSC